MNLAFGAIKMLFKIIILIGSFVTIKVLNTSITIGVVVSVTGAFFGGIAAILYLRKKMKQSEKELGLIEVHKKDNITDKEIFKKILSLLLILRKIKI